MSKSKDYYDVNIHDLIEHANEELKYEPDYEAYCLEVEHEELILWELYRLYKTLKDIDWSFYEAMDGFKYD